MFVQHVGCERKHINHDPTWKKAKEMLDECLNWFKHSFNIFYEKMLVHFLRKNSGPTPSNIVRKRIQHSFIIHVRWCWTNMLGIRFPWPLLSFKFIMQQKLVAVSEKYYLFNYDNSVSMKSITQISNQWTKRRFSLH